MAKSTDLFHILVPVWGREYTRSFLDYLVASLLAEGNLPAWPYCGNTLLQIATRQEDALQMEASPVFQRLRHYLPVQFQIFDLTQFGYLQGSSVFEAKQAILQQIMAQLFVLAMDASAHVIPLMGDTLLANGFFSYLCQVFNAETRLLLMAGPRLAPTAQGRLAPLKQNGVLALSPHQLNHWVFEQLHPHEAACFMDAPLFSQWPSHVYYWETPRQIRSHWFHLHPFFLYRPQVARQARSVALEMELLEQYATQPDTIGVVQQSETAACSLASDAEDMPAWGRESSLSERQEMLVQFGQKNCFPLQRWLFKHPILFYLAESEAVLSQTRSD
ncbi:MAG: hypothetical protein AB7I41_15195 [Candidatus Sericytochromatia bacterium]